MPLATTPGSCNGAGRRRIQPSSSRSAHICTRIPAGPWQEPSSTARSRRAFFCPVLSLRLCRGCSREALTGLDRINFDDEALSPHVPNYRILSRTSRLPAAAAEKNRANYLRRKGLLTIHLGPLAVALSEPLLRLDMPLRRLLGGTARQRVLVIFCGGRGCTQRETLVISSVGPRV